MCAPVRERVRRALLATSLLILAAVGCGTQTSDRKPVEAQQVNQIHEASGTVDSATAPAERTSTQPVEERVVAHEASAASPSTRVVLTSKGCVEFEPNWTTIRVGQSLSLRSELKTPVTIHVSSGAFDNAQYVVRPGAVVHTHPARSPGSYSIWTEPAACQTAPHGVQGPGPGLKVEAASEH
jgi:hypothetical protein